MAAEWVIVPVVAVVFVATLIRSAFDFGEALVAVPLLALVIPVEVAAPLAVLVSITVAAVVVVQDWHKVHVGSAWRLVVATLPGIPLGLRLLTAVAEHAVKATLAVVIVTFSAYCLAGYWLAGLWVPAVTRYYLLSLPAAVAAIVLGRAANRRLDGRRFVLYVHVGLIVVGAVLLVQSLWRWAGTG
jgi:uncharacterized membrane protein YfcA